MIRVFIALGANLGDAASSLNRAVASLASLPLTRLYAASSVYKTAPQGATAGLPAGNDYLNAVVAMDTTLAAPALLKHLQQIEQAAGRDRPYPNAPRTLDLDLLLYGEASIQSAQLTVPHPRMWSRAFVLVPLAEIAPQLASHEQLLEVAQQVIERVGELQVVRPAAGDQAG